jgi:hypothetical protein
MLEDITYHSVIVEAQRFAVMCVNTFVGCSTITYAVYWRMTASVV